MSWAYLILVVVVDTSSSAGHAAPATPAGATRRRLPAVRTASDAGPEEPRSKWQRWRQRRRPWPIDFAPGENPDAKPLDELALDVDHYFSAVEAWAAATFLRTLLDLPDVDSQSLAGHRMKMVETMLEIESRSFELFEKPQRNYLRKTSNTMLFAGILHAIAAEDWRPAVIGAVIARGLHHLGPTIERVWQSGPLSEIENLMREYAAMLENQPDVAMDKRLDNIVRSRLSRTFFQELIPFLQSERLASVEDAAHHLDRIVDDFLAQALASRQFVLDHLYVDDAHRAVRNIPADLYTIDTIFEPNTIDDNGNRVRRPDRFNALTPDAIAEVHHHTMIGLRGLFRSPEQPLEITM